MSMGDQRLRQWVLKHCGLQLSDKEISKITRGPFNAIFKTVFQKSIRSQEFIVHMRGNLYLHESKAARRNKDELIEIENEKKRLGGKNKELKELKNTKLHLLRSLENEYSHFGTIKAEKDEQNSIVKRQEVEALTLELRNRTIFKFRNKLDSFFHYEKLIDIDEIGSINAQRIDSSIMNGKITDLLSKELSIAPNASPYNLRIWINKLESDKSLQTINASQIQTPIMLVLRASQDEIKQLRKNHINLVVKNKYNSGKLIEANIDIAQKPRQLCSKANRPLVEEILRKIKAEAQVEFCNDKLKELQKSNAESTLRIVSEPQNSNNQTGTIISFLVRNCSSKLDAIGQTDSSTKEIVQMLLTELGKTNLQHN